MIAGSDQPTGPLVTFRSQDIFPPTALYVGPGDALHFEFKTPGFTGLAFLAIRFLSPQGEIIPEFYQLQVNASNTVDSVVHLPHAEGFILSAVISAGAQSRGQAFAQLKLHIGGGSGQEVHAHILCQGYLTAYDSLAYPLSPPESSISGRGFPLMLILADPGPGNQLVITVPAGRRWIFRGAVCAFITSATVINRTVELVLTQATPAGAMVLAYAPIPQPATMLWQYTFGAGLGTSSQNAFQNVGVAVDLALLAGMKITIGVDNLQAADILTGCRLLVEEFIAQ